MVFINNGKMSADFKINPMTSEHIDEIINLQRESDISYWSPKDYERLINDAQTINLVATHKQPKSQKTFGFVTSRLIITISYRRDSLLDKIKQTNGSKNQNESEIEIFNICIRKNFKRQGIGTILLKKLYEKCRSEAVGTIWLEVRETNTNAINFYTSHGFKKVYKRKNYYQNPSEDALVMRLNLTGIRTD